MIILSSLPAFGFQTKNVNVGSSCKYGLHTLEENINMERISRIAGYIPIIGTIMGCARIWGVLVRSEHEKLPNQVNHIVRGVMEVCCLGILLALIDLVVTAYRECRARYLSRHAELRHASS